MIMVLVECVKNLPKFHRHNDYAIHENVYKNRHNDYAFYEMCVKPTKVQQA